VSADHGELVYRNDGFIEEVSTTSIEPLYAELEPFLQCVRGVETPAVDGLARLEPDLLSGTLTIQLGQLLLLLTGELAAEANLSPGDAFEALCSLPPHALRRRLRAVLADVEHARAALQRKEQLHLQGRVRWEVPDPLEELPRGGSRPVRRGRRHPRPWPPAICAPAPTPCCRRSPAAHRSPPSRSRSSTTPPNPRWWSASGPAARCRSRLRCWSCSPAGSGPRPACRLRAPRRRWPCAA
ncbi:MAG: hypothetical protein ACKOPS_15560, partial [Cyanobium sp.]